VADVVDEVVNGLGNVVLQVASVRVAYVVDDVNVLEADNVD